MDLIQALESRAEHEGSPFQKQLLLEDIERLKKIWDLCEVHSDQQEFLKAGLFIGWTNGDLRTTELKEPIENLLRSIFKLCKEGANEEAERDVRQAWITFIQIRMEKLVHCL